MDVSKREIASTREKTENAKGAQTSKIGPAREKTYRVEETARCVYGVKAVPYINWRHAPKEMASKGSAEKTMESQGR